MGFPWVDLLFLIFVGFYAWRGYHRGVIRESLDLLGFLVGLFLAVRFYAIPGAVFRFLGMGDGWSNALGGLIIFASLITAGALSAKRIHSTERFADGLAKPIHVGGAVLASTWSAMFAAFILVVLTVIPTPPRAQAAIRDSVVGGGVLKANSPLYTVMEEFASHEARNLLFFLRQYFVQLNPPEEQGDEEFFRIQPSNQIELDEAAEEAILAMVNREREANGLGTVKLHVEIREVARAHSADMYRRGYFAHKNPDGMDPFDRMEEGGVRFTFAGENLALAPTVEMVHRGLMNSPRHRDNILKTDFTDLGIGVYKGPYGLMVTQNFCAGCREEP